MYLISYIFNVSSMTMFGCLCACSFLSFSFLISVCEALQNTGVTRRLHRLVPPPVFALPCLLFLTQPLPYTSIVIVSLILKLRNVP